MSPSNRPSKQRRAAENRARRQALAARRDNATYEPPVRERTSAKPSGRATGGAGGASAAPRRGAGSYFRLGTTPRREGRQVGALALQIALSFAVVGAFVLPSAKVYVDENGDRMGNDEYEERRDNDEDIPSETWWEFYGPGITIAGMVAPIAVTGYAFYEASRGRRRIWVAFASMLALGVTTTFAGSMFTLGAMVAVAVASFQMRRAQLKATAVESAVDEVLENDGVIEVDSVEVEPDAETSARVDDVDPLSDGEAQRKD